MILCDFLFFLVNGFIFQRKTYILSFVVNIYNNYLRVVFIARRQKNFNDDMGAYLARIKGSSDDSGNFFKRVDSLIPKRSKKTEEVPEVDNINSTVVDGQKKTFWLWALFTPRSRSFEDEDLEVLPEEVKEEAYALEEEIEEIDDEVEDLENKRDSLFARLFSLFTFSKKEEDYSEDVDPELVAKTLSESQKNEDLINETRIVLKSLHRWLSKLSPEQIDSFKRSPDFHRYKDLLDKYGLIK